MAETIEVREGEDFDLSAVERYMRERIEGLPEGELEVRQFPSGASNLTYLVKIGDWEGVLRRPPQGPLPPKAHDMGRESDLLMKLHEAFPLAPKPYFFTDDESIIGAPFYVMERREGINVDDSFPEGVEPTEELCRGMSRMIADTLVELHAVDWREAGLEELGRPEGFLERQVKGWIGRYDEARTEEIEEVEPLTEWISRDIPESPPATIIHNDYKLNNLILNPDDLTEVRAVVDWEMATIGDPLFDLAVSLSYWVEADDSQELKEVLPTVTDMPGFFTRKEFIDYYGERSGRDISDMHWYMVFGYFKLAVILQQIYARWYNGQTQDNRFANFNERVRNVILHAHELSRKGDL
jgi:aminoglycoside phosphotransferase (APT) family kinase protein